MPDFSQCACPIFIEEKGVPTLIATATLLKIQNAHFFLTASHVFQKYGDKPFYFCRNRGMCQLSGLGGMTRASTGNDLCDCAFIALDDRLASYIAELYAFLPIEYADVNSCTSWNGAYEFSGFPWRKSKVNKQSGCINLALYGLRTCRVNDRLYHTFGISPLTHIAVEFDPQKMTNDTKMTVTASHPEGMSGGPVWSFLKIGNDNDGCEQITKRLAGIATTYKRDHRCLVAARISAILERIRIKFPALSPSIPTNPELVIISNSDFK